MSKITPYNTTDSKKKQVEKMFDSIAKRYDLLNHSLSCGFLNFTKIVPTAALSFFYLCAFYLLTFVVNKLPIAIVYATWSGLGIFTIAIMGYVFFKQTLAWQAVLGLFLIVVGVILVNSFTGKVS